MKASGKKGTDTIGENCISLKVNGNLYELAVGPRPGQIDSSHNLAQVLREALGFKGTKVSCDTGACGSCTVLMDGKAVNSCMILAVECSGREITTIEGLGDSRNRNVGSPPAGLY